MMTNLNQRVAGVKRRIEYAVETDATEADLTDYEKRMAAMVMDALDEAGHPLRAHDRRFGVATRPAGAGEPDASP